MRKVFNRLGQKVALLLGEPHSQNAPHAAGSALKSNLFDTEPLAKHLFFEAYDDQAEIFINTHSLGFVLEAFPLMGCDQTVQKVLSGLFQDFTDEGASLQFLLWADHRIDQFLDPWEKSSKRGGIFLEMAKKRREYYRTHLANSARIFRFIISYSIPIGTNLEGDVRRVSQVKAKMMEAFKSLTGVWTWKPKELLETGGALLNFSLDTAVNRRTYDSYQSLSSQLMTGGKLNINEDFLLWNEEVAHKSFRVVDTPSQWSPHGMQQLIGDFYRETFRINYPFFIHYGVHFPSQAKVENSFWRRSQLIENQGKSSYLIRLIPELASELKECDLIRRSVNQGAKFVWTQLSTGVWAPKDQLSQAEQSLRNVFKINYFNLAENKYLHFPHLLSILPMNWSEFISDLKQQNMLKTTITSECANFIPIQGEWLGTMETPGMLLAGRRGQLLNWCPFDNKSGNYNCVVLGRSGSGKSVFMQELLMSGLRNGARVYVLDVGRSFQKMCEAGEGQFVAFARDTAICLNPFSNLSIEDQSDKEDAFSFLKSIIACMAAPSKGTTDFENSLIEKAVKSVWEAKQNASTITDIVHWLTAHKDQRANDLGIMLTPYTKDGVYAKYFEGQNNCNFSNPLVVIELQELQSRKDLQSVILQLFIMTIANAAFLGDRKTPFYLCIDEASDLLRAPQTVSFIETLARRLRKYKGSLVVGTQNIEDFFSAPGAKAAYDNSDWTCFLAQKPDAIDTIVHHQQMKWDEQKVNHLKSLTKVDGQYSEVMIGDADGNYSIARLMLDPFSQLLYSTKPEEFARLKDMTSKGFTIVEAINKLIQGRQTHG